MQLSNNFYLSELVHSNTAVRLGIDNTPGEAEIESLRLVAQNILQPIRDHYKIPFSPSSGFRGLELNRLLKSKDSSQHVKGQAVDIELPGISNLDLATWIRDNLSYDQLILEFHTIGEPYSGWVHCSYVQQMARMEVLTFADRQFRQGLIA